MISKFEPERRATKNEQHDSKSKSKEEKSVSMPSAVVLENSVIKRYHVYQIRPPMFAEAPSLLIDREYTNIKDKNACLVWIPPLSSYSNNVHDTVTDESRQLYLRDIAGLPVGHVPKSLAGTFRDILDDGGCITAQVTGNPMPSFPPWPAQTEQGGGVVVPCNYAIQHSNRLFISDHFRNALENMPEGDSMHIR